MKTYMQERYNPIVMGVNSAITLGQGIQAIAGFLAVTAGTITVVNNKGVTVLNAYPVAAGSFNRLPIYVDIGSTASVTLAGGAGGTLLL